MFTTYQFVYDLKIAAPSSFILMRTNEIEFKMKNIEITSN